MSGRYWLRRADRALFSVTAYRLAIAVGCAFWAVGFALMALGAQV